MPFRSGQNNPALRTPPQKAEGKGVGGRSRIEELPNGLLLNRTGKLYTADGISSDSFALARARFAKCFPAESGAAVDYPGGGVDDALQQVPGVVVVIKRCRDKRRGLTCPQRHQLRDVQLRGLASELPR